MKTRNNLFPLPPQSVAGTSKGPRPLFENCLKRWYKDHPNQNHLGSYEHVRLLACPRPEFEFNTLPDTRSWGLVWESSRFLPAWFPGDCRGRAGIKTRNQCRALTWQ